MSNKNTHNTSHYFNSFAEALDFVLLKRKLNQSELSDIAKKDHSQISRWISGKVKPSQKTKIELENVLGCVFTRDSQGWKVEMTDTDFSASLEGKVAAYERQLSAEGLSNSAQAELIGYLQARLESLSKEILEVSKLLNTIRPK